VGDLKVLFEIRLGAVPRRAEPRLLSGHSIRKLDAVVFRNVIVVRTAGPVKDVTAPIAPDRSLILFAARDPVVLLVQAERALRAMSEILRLDRVRISPQPDVTFPCGISATE